jgi:hypothetical protein
MAGKVRVSGQLPTPLALLAHCVAAQDNLLSLPQPPFFFFNMIMINAFPLGIFPCNDNANYPIFYR